ncbi:16S rRNA (guanine(966)-N(2))-methyltransferase RsmD [Dendrosporobacter sp. 1207_IL3150]|uniref:16S rRNA (guanine(966)-N(2))-methyltransferase RsmD n=1 Tax=Dendrosporobacter sp. 1207_IL3150 TaxID=3084054 RepID=UPI002FDB2A4E
MRIITGKAKGAKLKAPRGLDTRPTTDRVKESIFNILGDVVNGAKVLDLFAGTGNLGLEALSRGATQAVFIDQSAVSIGVIKDNAAHTKLVDYAEIHKGDVLRVLDRLSNTDRMFDLVFCDPPYNKGYVRSVLEKLDQNGIFAEQGILVLEHSRHESVEGEWKSLELRRSEKYGETIVSFFIYQSKH